MQNNIGLHYKFSMPRIIISCIVCLGLLPFSQPAEAGSRGISVQLKESERQNAPDAESVKLYSSSYALVIGNDAYNNGWPRLSGAVNDARLVAEELEKKGFEVTLKTNLDSSQLGEAFNKFFVVQGDDPDARLFVWFAGHGHTLNGEGYLVPIDAPSPNTDEKGFKLTALSLRNFGIYVRQAISKHAFAVFDSCFAGTVFEAQRSMPPTAITRATTKPVRQFLTSGDANQTVSDNGSFRTLFIRALESEEHADANDDGYLTASELGMFLTDRVTNLTRARQTPKYGKLNDLNWDQGDFVFELPSTRTSVKEPVTAVSKEEKKKLENDLAEERKRLEADRAKAKEELSEMLRKIAREKAEMEAKKSTQAAASRERERLYQQRERELLYQQQERERNYQRQIEENRAKKRKKRTYIPPTF